jgi:hypothetical protein
MDAADAAHVTRSTAALAKARFNPDAADAASSPVTAAVA